MKIYQRTLHRYSQDGTKTVIVERYTQPFKDRVRFNFIRAIDAILAVPPIHWTIDCPLENLHRTIHRVRCNNDCVKGEVRVSEDVWEESVFCGLVPLCAMYSMKYYDASMKNTVVVGSDTV